MILKYVLIILHILFAAAWFGLSLRLGSWARTVLDLPRDAAELVYHNAGKSVRLLGLLLIVQFVTALALFLGTGGFAVYGPEYHTSITLALLMIAFHYVLIQPSWGKLFTVGESAQKKLSMGLGLSHLFWFIILVLMFLHDLTGAVHAH